MDTSSLPLPAVSSETLAIYAAQRPAIVQAVVAQCLLHPEDVAPLGAQAEQTLTRGLEFTTQALAVAMQVQDGTLLDQQVAWGNARLPHDQITQAQLLQRFQWLAAVISELLPPDHAQVVGRYVQRMIDAEQAALAALPA